MSDGVIHVVDDDDAVRDSLSFLFESSGFAVETYASGSDALERMAPRAADCIVTDVRMPGMSGLDLLRNLREKGLATPVIVITGHGDVPLAVEAMRSGAADFIEKPFEEEALLASVRRALGATQQAPSGEAAERLARLSERERQVLAGLVEGRLNKTIAHDLDISVRTVEVYRAKLMSKMQAASFADLVRMAIKAGVAKD